MMLNRKKWVEYRKQKREKGVYKGVGEVVKGEMIGGGGGDNVWFINGVIVLNGEGVRFGKRQVGKKSLGGEKKEEGEKGEL